MDFKIRNTVELNLDAIATDIQLSLEICVKYLSLVLYLSTQNGYLSP